MKAKIIEIFRSVQGEGKYAGVIQVFVRFAGCNLKCDWCDTVSIESSSTNEDNFFCVDEVYERVSNLLNVCHSVSFTGGEPLLQSKFLKSLVLRLNKHSSKIYLETNGVLYEELNSLIDMIDIVSMDIKIPSSSKCEPYWEEHHNFFKIAKQKDLFVKVVISGDTDILDFEKVINIFSSEDGKDIPLFIQPESNKLNDDVIKKCLEIQEYCLRYINDVRIIPQIHKFLNIS